MTRRRRWKHPARTAILLVFGMLGIAYETVFEHGERPSLLIAFMGCLGLPVMFPSDKDDPDDEPPTKPEAPSKVET